VNPAKKKPQSARGKKKKKKGVGHHRGKGRKSSKNKKTNTKGDSREHCKKQTSRFCVTKAGKAKMVSSGEGKKNVKIGGAGKQNGDVNHR